MKSTIQLIVTVNIGLEKILLTSEKRLIIFIKPLFSGEAFRYKIFIYRLILLVLKFF